MFDLSLEPTFTNQKYGQNKIVMGRCYVYRQGQNPAVARIFD